MKIVAPRRWGSRRSPRMIWEAWRNQEAALCIEEEVRRPAVEAHRAAREDVRRTPGVTSPRDPNSGEPTCDLTDAWTGVLYQLPGSRRSPTASPSCAPAGTGRRAYADGSELREEATRSGCSLTSDEESNRYVVRGGGTVRLFDGDGFVQAYRRER